MSTLERRVFFFYDSFDLFPFDSLRVTEHPSPYKRERDREIFYNYYIKYFNLLWSSDLYNDNKPSKFLREDESSRKRPFPIFFSENDWSQTR